MSNKLLIFGGQYGSEGKGAVLAHYASRTNYSYTVRGGGPQAGHTFYTPKYGKVVVRQVPVGALFGAIGYLGPGAVVDPQVLHAEIEAYGLQGRVWVHPNAFQVTWNDQDVEKDLVTRGHIPGSTCEGTGNARARKALRMGTYGMDGGVYPIDPLCSFVDRSLEHYHDMLENWNGKAGKVLVEGCQGFGLSNNHGKWPYVTSGDVTPASILSECGLNIQPDLYTMATLRTFPIRVGGNSGPMGDETTFDALGQEPELTTVTKRQRRIAYFDVEHLAQMDAVCNPDGIALTFLDYLTSKAKDLTAWQDLLDCDEVRLFLSLWPVRLRNKLMLLGTGPYLQDYVGPCSLEEIFS